MVRAGYSPHWDPNFFRALDDVSRTIAHTLPEKDRAAFLDTASATRFEGDTK